MTARISDPSWQSALIPLQIVRRRTTYHTWIHVHDVRVYAGPGTIKGHFFSTLQRRENYCSSPYFPKNFSCSGHDHVDLSLCFEDTAILYGICALFWILAGFKFLCGNNVKPSIRFNLLHMAKLVSLVLFIGCLVFLSNRRLGSSLGLGVDVLDSICTHSCAQCSARIVLNHEEVLLCSCLFWRMCQFSSNVTVLPSFGILSFSDSDSRSRGDSTV